MAGSQLHCMAHGGAGNLFRFYFYGGVLPSKSLVLVEAILNTLSRELAITVKAENSAHVEAFMELWSSLIQSF